MIELIEKKSKFYGYCFSVKCEEDVKSILAKIKAQHKKCTHVCYSYILSLPHAEKAVDDGEPSGTAGRPILNVLQKREEKDKLIVIVRYFGGIKLGAGGLIRAYSKSANMALEDFYDSNRN